MNYESLTASNVMGNDLLSCGLKNKENASYSITYLALESYI